MNDPNAGKYGLSKDERVIRNYEKLAISAKVLGLTIGPLTKDGVVVRDGYQSVIAVLSRDDILKRPKLI